MVLSIPARRYDLRGGIDVNMYNTLLEPGFALGVDEGRYSDEEEKGIWDRFCIESYRRKVLELAIPLLVEQLQHLPESLQVMLVPGSVSICSPHDYSYGGDELRFTIKAHTAISGTQMQALLDAAVASDWQAEFGSHYRICELLGERYSIHDFLKEEPTIEQEGGAHERDHSHHP